jgi:transcriptional regulator with XRE-family HTH domain
LSTPLGESPAVARRRVRRALRQAREAKGLTQAQVADEMEWSLSKVTRIENGEVSISATDLRVLLEFLGITDREVVAQLAEDARVSRRQRWILEDRRYRDLLTEATRQLVQFEAEAAAIRYFQHMLVPGVLQTPAYAQAVLEHYREHLTGDEIQRRFEVRQQRQKQLLARRDPLEFLVLLDESVLHRQLGGPVVMGEQLQSLLRIMRQGKVLIRIAPFTEAAPIALLGPFIILDLDEEDSILYREERLSDQIVQDPPEIERHRTAFEDLWRVAYDDNESARLLKERATAMLSSHRSRPPG